MQRTKVLSQIRFALSTQKRFKQLENGPLYSTPREDFFNRTKEIEYFKTVFTTEEPAIHVVLGAQNTGKSRLLNKVFYELQEDEALALAHMDLRSRTMTNYKDFYYHLHEESKRFLQQWKGWANFGVNAAKVAARLSGTVFETLPQAVKDAVVPKLDPATLKEMVDFALPEDKPKTRSEVEVMDVGAMLNRMSDKVPSYTRWRGLRVPLVHIDEANELDILSRKSPDDLDALREFFKWTIQMTKQSSQLHIVLSSSDAFFLFWLKSFIGDRIKVHVVGDLPKEEAHKFFKRLQQRYAELRKADNPTIKLDFDKDVYPVTGGSMFLMEQMVSDYVIKGVSLEENSRVETAMRELRKAIATPKGETFNSARFGHLTARWTPVDMRLVITQINSNGGYAVYDDLLQKISQDALDSIIQHNVLTYRHELPIVSDIPNLPKKAVVIPASPLLCYAMRNIKV